MKNLDGILAEAGHTPFGVSSGLMRSPSASRNLYSCICTPFFLAQALKTCTEKLYGTKLIPLQQPINKAHFLRIYNSGSKPYIVVGHLPSGRVCGP